MKFNGKCFIYNKIEHQANNYKNKAEEKNLERKKIAEDNVTRVNNLINKVLNMRLYAIVLTVDLVNNIEY